VSKAYTEVFYHFVWATRGREPLINAELEPHLYSQIRHKCEELKVRVHALNGVPDHVHLACTLPVTLSISAAIQQLKGSSSHFVNHLAPAEQRFDWQEGYGALTFAKRELPRIVAYVDRQKAHHASGTLSAKMERRLAPFMGVPRCSAAVSTPRGSTHNR